MAEGGGKVGEVRNPVLFAVLSLVCFLVALYWIYKVIIEINEYLGVQKLNPLIVIGFFVPIVNILIILYIWFTFGKSLMEMQQKKGVPAEDKTIVILIVGFLCAPAAIFMMQTELNKLWE